MQVVDQNTKVINQEFNNQKQITGPLSVTTQSIEQEDKLLILDQNKLFIYDKNTYDIKSITVDANKMYNLNKCLF